MDRMTYAQCVFIISLFIFEAFITCKIQKHFDYVTVFSYVNKIFSTILIEKTCLPCKLLLRITMYIHCHLVNKMLNACFTLIEC